MFGTSDALQKPFKGHTRQDFDRAVCNDEPQFDPEVFSPHAISLLKGVRGWRFSHVQHGT